jgi:hypothetical protein
VSSAEDGRYDATGQSVVVLTLRLITGMGWGHNNYSIRGLPMK